MNTYCFDKDHIVESDRYDVLIAGGGTAGAVAGISAARQGAKTLIVEQFGGLGGSQTMGLVSPIMSTHIEGDPQSSAISDEIRKRLQSIGAAPMGDMVKGYFDTTALKCVLEDMVTEAGCDLVYHTTLIGVIKDGDTVTHAVLFGSEGIHAVYAKVFIDATADGVLSLLSGAAYESGNAEGYNQAVTLRFVMEGVDSRAFEDYNIALGDMGQRRYPLLHAASVNGDPNALLAPVFTKAYEEGIMTWQDIRCFQCFSLPGRRYALAFNCPELGKSKNVLAPDYLTNRQIEGKRAIRRLTEALCRYMPGFENAYVAEIAQMMGIRESRRIVCEYMLSAQDVANYARFDDYIATSNYPIDIHDAGDVNLQYADAPENERYYQIPLRSLVVKGMDNLFVVGRCLGADFIAQSSTRVQASCRASGEAAGIAAWMAAQGGQKAKSIDGAAVRNIMKARGAQFEPISAAV